MIWRKVETAKFSEALNFATVRWNKQAKFTVLTGRIFSEWKFH